MKTFKEFISEIKDLKDACWKGYTAIGLKKKNGKTVPNCVKESLFESFDPKFDVKHFGWQKSPKDETHTINFMTSNKTPYQMHLRQINPNEGHHLGFQTLGSTRQKSLDRTGKHEIREVIGSVMGLAIQKAKEDPNIKKIHYQGADEGLQKAYGMIAKSPSFHRTLAQHGFRYAGLNDKLHTIEKI